MERSEPDRSLPAKQGAWPGGPPPMPSAMPSAPPSLPQQDEQQEDSRRGFQPWRVFQEVRLLRAEIESLRAELGSLRAEGEEHQDRLAKLYEVVHGLRADRTTELESAHHETARAYAALREQIVGRCANAVDAALEERRDLHERQDRWEAHVRLTAAMFRTVLGEHPAVEQNWHHTAAQVLGVDGKLGPVTDLHRQTAELRARIAELGGVHRWNFELRLGDRPDAALHELWPRADDREPLTLCVAPAYQVVGRTPHVRPLVHTAIGRV
ncbi:hypothetical protein OG625_07535 [Streptomyces sp. NBC_01351]|uniref:hypothetical protein n=1 Tax=Streptomyces sp. NBC_01351 TaxID=2903833 RepID=UPI002E35923B|nr:hypothetical protein [Streptomyces sp. NBC_01351]